MIERMPRQTFRTDDFGPRLRMLRVERGWTQSDLATRAEVTQRAIYHYETSGQYPPAPVVLKLAETFDISMDALMGRTELRKPKASTDNPNLLEDADDRRLWRKFQQLRHLTDRQQQRILSTISDLLPSERQRSGAA